MDNRLYVQQVMVGANPALNFTSLGEQTQDRIYDFLDKVKVDDFFGFYMRRTYYKTKGVQSRKQTKKGSKIFVDRCVGAVLSGLVDLVEEGAEEVKKPKESKPHDKKHNKKHSNKK